MPKQARVGRPAIPQLTVSATMDVLRTTVPRLEELTRDSAPAHLYEVTDYGWSVNHQLAHLRACHDVLGGNMLKIIREDHPTWKGRSPRTGQERYFEWTWEAAITAFRAQRAELLAELEPLPLEAWERTATVTAPPNTVYEYSTLYYGDWMARHERSHVRHMARILEELA
jgi:hypothetical protein